MLPVCDLALVASYDKQGVLRYNSTTPYPQGEHKVPIRNNEIQVTIYTEAEQKNVSLARNNESFLRLDMVCVTFTASRSMKN